MQSSDPRDSAASSYGDGGHLDRLRRSTLIKWGPMRSQPIKAIIFDLGGVLLDWNPRYLYRRYFATADAMEAFLAEIDFPAWNAQQDAGRCFAEAVAELSARFPQYARLISAYPEHWEESVAGPIGGTVRLLRALKRAGYPLFALSNWSAETFPIARRKYSFLELFDHVVISGEVSLVKPDRRIFELAARTAHLAAGECLVIDDAAENIAVASSIGFPTLHFKSAESLETRLIELGVLEPSWRDNLAL